VAVVVLVEVEADEVAGPAADADVVTRRPDPAYVGRVGQAPVLPARRGPAAAGWQGEHGQAAGDDRHRIRGG
jgi:hypothetical protein